MQGDVYQSCDAHLARVDTVGQRLIAYDTHILHSLQGDIVQIYTALSLRPVRIPTGSDGGIGLDVVSIGTGIEDEALDVAQGESLEEGEVSIRLHGLLEDIVALHIVLIVDQQPLHGHLHTVHTRSGVVGHRIDLALQGKLQQGKLLDLGTVVGTRHLIL